MHAQRKDTVLFGNGDGVVDVARVLAVDGDDELPAKIEAAPQILLIEEAVLLLFCLFEDIFGEIFIEMMGADEGELFREEVALFAEYFLDLAHGRIVGAEGSDLCDRLALRRAVVGLARQDEDIAGVLSLIGMQIADLSFAAEGADELRVSARKDG